MVSSLILTFIISHTNSRFSYSVHVSTMTVYDKHCPIKKVCIKSHEIRKPWFTNGIKNACNKKNNLYKQFLSCRTKNAEEKYKKYKNKLTTILRRCEKNYYNELLQSHQNDVKGTWKILNSIIKKSNNNSNYPTEFVNNGIVLNNKKDIANGFNDFFVNIGPQLAKKINPPKEGNM